MSETPEVRIVSDVGTLKALASVIRRRMLSFLEENGQATSADVARALGESTGTTSYHLRLLARHGLVREVESASRRERWWCKVPLDLRFPPVDENTPAAERDAHLDLHRQRLTEDLVQLSRLVKLDDPADLAWTRMSRSSIRVTRAQLDELGAELRALMFKYAAPNAGRLATGRPTTDGPAAEASTADEATELIQLRLYAFREQGIQPDAAQHLAGE
jgi:DNA-binding transcriptional ArsR family regulator